VDIAVVVAQHICKLGIDNWQLRESSANALIEKELKLKHRWKESEEDRNWQEQENHGDHQRNLGSTSLTHHRYLRLRVEIVD